MFEVHSKYHMLEQSQPGKRAFKVDSYFSWTTPFLTLEEAKEHKDYLERVSRAYDIEIKERVK